MKTTTQTLLTILPACLLILNSAAQQPHAPGSGGTVAGSAYRILPNDTVRSVAAHFQMTPRDLMRQLRKPFRPGQVIFVNPPGKSTEQTADWENWMGQYAVQPGETLEQVAAKLQVSTEEIGELNAKEITADVLTGDTLAKIAHRYSIAVEKIADWNECFLADSLYPGMKLTVGWDKIVPGENLYYPIHSRAVENIDRKKLSRDQFTYTVRKGDTVERLAAQQNCSVREIRDLNAMGESEQPKTGELLFLLKSPLTGPKTDLASHGRLWDGQVIHDTMLLRSPGTNAITRIKVGMHISIVGTWADGYAVLLTGKGYGWASRKDVLIGQYAVDATPNRNINQAIKVAYTYLGVPYVFGGSTYHGIDCSALIKNAMVAANVWKPEAPRVACDQMHVGTPVAVDQLRAGDRIYFYFGRTPPGFADHTALYIGGGQVIHASSSHHGVTIANLFSGGLWRAFMGARRDATSSRTATKRETLKSVTL